MSEQEFAEQYSNGFDRVVRFVRSKGIRLEPEEVAQQAWARAWEMRHQFKGSADIFQSWVIVIAHNLLRQAWRRKDLFEQDDLTIQMVTVTMDDSDSIDVKRILRRYCPRDYRKSVVDWYIKEKRSKKSTLRMTAYRGIRAIRKRMKLKVAT